MDVQPKDAPGSGSRIRVATYRRISTDESNQPYSLESQSDRLGDFIRSQPDSELVADYVDRAPGATASRPGLLAALEAAERHEFDVLLVYRVDRLTRSIVDLMMIDERLTAAGAALRSATEPLDTQQPVGRMLMQLLGIFAEFERSLLMDRIAAGFERKASRGEWILDRDEVHDGLHPGIVERRLFDAAERLRRRRLERTTQETPPASTLGEGGGR